jgi:hypothetical protein
MLSPTLGKPLALGAMVVGLIGGSYGIASAASGSGSSTGSSTTTPSPPTGAPTGPPPGASAGNPWGKQRSDETLLTGDTLAKVTAAAVAKEGSGATIVRIETDADGHAAYEAHMVKADGTPVTVYVNRSYEVVSAESR